MQVNIPGDLLDDPRVDFAAAELACDADLVVGKIARVIRGALQKRTAVMPARWIDAYARMPGFAKALVSVGLAAPVADQVRLHDDVIAKQLGWLADQDVKRAKALEAKRKKAGLPGGVPRDVPGDLPIESETGIGTEIGTGTGSEHKESSAASGSSLSTPKVPDGFEEAKETIARWAKQTNEGTRQRWTQKLEEELANVLADVPWSTVQYQALAYFEQYMLPSHYGPPYNLAGLMRALERGDLAEPGQWRRERWEHDQAKKKQQQQGAA